MPLTSVWRFDLNLLSRTCSQELASSLGEVNFSLSLFMSNFKKEKSIRSMSGSWDCILRVSEPTFGFEAH